MPTQIEKHHRILNREDQKRNSSPNIIVKELNSQNKMYTKGYDKDHVIWKDKPIIKTIDFVQSTSWKTDVILNIYLKFSRSVITAQDNIPDKTTIQNKGDRKNYYITKSR